ncbi:MULTISPECIES: hypothetical protein [Streptomyces]|uniref:Uncharacterized protein n=1 Tax=Streptomyces toyocaensis TaxID=55952 RepID=A0A081XU38_STRTO|nr:hypothetical protein [Streptomyces toyocaensis]KES07061.1 hypothetical protein BU52_10715 [Streptomyces toyocaensis]
MHGIKAHTSAPFTLTPKQLAAHLGCSALKAVKVLSDLQAAGAIEQTGPNAWRLTMPTGKPTGGDRP